MILDSSFLIDLLRNPEGNAKQKAEELDNKFEIKCISSISALELWRGALQSTNSEKERKKVEEFLQSLLVYPVGLGEAKKAAEIEVDLLKRGELIDWEDILIAGTALVHNMPIVTKNVKHFSKISGVLVEKY